MSGKKSYIPPKVQGKKNNQRPMNDWIEGERKLNERIKKEKEEQRKRAEEGKKRLHHILTNWSSYKKK